VPVNPFSARSGVDPRVFVGREEELRFFRHDRLVSAVAGRCNHYVITGTWGIGKTALLRQMKLSAQTQGAWALLFCMRGFGPGESLTDFARHVLDMAAADLPIQPRSPGPYIKGAGATALGFGLQVDWGLPSSGVGSDPQLLLRDGLLKMHDHGCSNGAKALVLLIDDVHNLSTGGEQLTLLRNVLTDERVADRTNILVVLSSIERGWDPFLVRDHPVGRLFMPRRCVGLFEKDETLELIEESLRETGVAFDAAVSDRVHHITRGHVFEVQALCEALFDRQIRGRVSMENWETALHHTLLALADAEFKGMLGRASDQEQAALRVLAAGDEVLGPHALAERCPEIKGAAEVLTRLTAKGLAERAGRGRYRLSDRLFAEYVRRYGAAV
jgi:hypothetical protein